MTTISDEMSDRVEHLGRNQRGQHFQRIQWRVLQLCGDHLHCAGIDQKSTLHCIKPKRADVTQYLRVRRYDARRSAMLKVVDCVLVARKSIKQVEIDERNSAGVRVPCDTSSRSSPDCR